MGAGSSFHTDLPSGKSASEVVLTLAISVGTSRTFQDGLSAPSRSRATQQPHSRIPSVKCVEEECDSCRVTIPPSQLPFGHRVCLCCDSPFIGNESGPLKKRCKRRKVVFSVTSSPRPASLSVGKVQCGWDNLSLLSFHWFLQGANQEIRYRLSEQIKNPRQTLQPQDRGVQHLKRLT